MDKHFEFGSLSSSNTLFDSGLSSVLTGSASNSITSGSPPLAFSSNYIERPDSLFSEVKVPKRKASSFTTFSYSYLSFNCKVVTTRY
ncbi:unnamed protein product [Caenorhabditis bovis]|uniref:Uncharacterized protein n=1 Tax=Caenorhabditis bovis TaxID=2654633 RepID=A0A8S1E925_9PELO|nr:unnamed protein product [Caenorhabditis bovis]